jgi:hypothetical protein
MKADEILDELRAMGNEATKKMLMENHGLREPCFGVKIGDMKKIVKRIKKDYQLALDLYDTGNYDAMYLAGLIADDARMTREDLQSWADRAYGGALPGSTVAWVAAGSPHGWEMALEWIESPAAAVAAAGWATLGSLVAITADPELDLPALKRLVRHVQESIRQAPDAVRYQMNGFIISVGCHVRPLTECALLAGEKLGAVSMDMGKNQCQVPFAPDYIRKVEQRGTIGKKRKSVKC